MTTTEIKALHSGSPWGYSKLGVHQRSTKSIHTVEVLISCVQQLPLSPHYAPYLSHLPPDLKQEALLLMPKEAAIDSVVRGKQMLELEVILDFCNEEKVEKEKNTQIQSLSKTTLKIMIHNVSIILILLLFLLWNFALFFHKIKK